MTFRANWGFGIAVVYTVFAAGTLGVAIYAFGQRVDLVSPDYYAKSLAYDQHREAMTNGDASGVDAAVEDGAVVVHWPADAAAGASGTATFYRASDDTADRVVPLAPQRGAEHLPLDGLRPGRWTLQLDWTQQGRAFYVERAIVVP